GACPPVDATLSAPPGAALEDRSATPAAVPCSAVPTAATISAQLAYRSSGSFAIPCSRASSTAVDKPVARETGGGCPFKCPLITAETSPENGGPPDRHA